MTRELSSNYSPRFTSAVFAILIVLVSCAVLAQTTRGSQRLAQRAGGSPQLGAATENPPVHFLKPVVYPTGGFEPLSVAIADLNGDGHPDLVVANWCLPTTNCVQYGLYEIGAVSVLLGNGDGTFQTAVTYGTGGYGATSVAIADVNGDGHPDLLVGNYCQDSVCWMNGIVGVLLGNGDGTFQAPVSYDSGGHQPQSVAIADVNGDGKPDVVVANTSSGTVGVLLSNGDGTFQPPLIFGWGDLVFSVAVADVNGDRKPDIVAGSSSIAVFQGNGDGTFQALGFFNPGGSAAVSVALADVNRDGKPDIVAADLSGTVSVLLGNGNGTFQPPLVYRSGGYFSYSVAVGDVNGDHKHDLIVANAYQSSNRNNGGTVTVLLGNGDGTFRPVVSYSSGGDFALSVAIGDVNGDGKLDLLVGNGGSNSVGVLLSNSGFTTTTQVTSSSNPSFVNQSVTFTAAVTSKPPIPDGRVVTFYDGKTAIGAGSTKGGLATFTTSALSAGNHIVKAAYSGDPSHASSSGTLKQVVNAYATSTLLTSTLNPSIYGQAVTFTAKVTTTGSITPTAKVRFTWGIYTIGSATLDSSGVATLTKSNLNADPYPLTAVYIGDANNQGSTSPVLNQVVQHTTSAATITSSLNPSTVGQAVTFTAKITSPTVEAKGPVTFTLGKTTLGTAQLNNGKATFATSSLPAGRDAVKATYYGDSNIAGNSASVTQVVQP